MCAWYKYMESFVLSIWHDNLALKFGHICPKRLKSLYLSSCNMFSIWVFGLVDVWPVIFYEDFYVITVAPIIYWDWLFSPKYFVSENICMPDLPSFIIISAVSESQTCAAAGFWFHLSTGKQACWCTCPTAVDVSSCSWVDWVPSTRDTSTKSSPKWWNLVQKESVILAKPASYSFGK